MKMMMKSHEDVERGMSIGRGYAIIAAYTCIDVCLLPSLHPPTVYTTNVFTLVIFVHAQAPPLSPLIRDIYTTHVPK